LAKAQYPSILFSHQRLCNDLLNFEDVAPVIENAPNKVLMSINGHEHIDEAEEVNGIWYYNVNSITSYWVGEAFTAQNRYGEEVDKNYPWLCCTIPYKEAVYPIITIDENGATVKGKQSVFVGPGPEELGVYNEGSYFAEILRTKITPGVEDRYMPFK